jgi:hypothetical protein
MRSLRSAGVQAQSCHEPGEPALPCNALIKGRRCPVDAGIDAVVCVRLGKGAAASVGEFGAICALRAGRPLIMTGMSAEHPLESWADHIVAADGDLASACLAFARTRVP